MVPLRDPSAPSEPLGLFPLGGLGQIGMNCMALRCGGDVIMVDCGVQYPEAELGLEVLCPELRWAVEHRSALRGIVITHGHEDHIGALPYLNSVLPLRIWAPPYAAELIRERARESEAEAQPDVVVYHPGDSFQIGSFSIEAIAVTHSIVGACALAIRTPAGLVVHSGDFKFDDAPMDGQRTDEARLEALGDEGVTLLMSDSTNVFSPGYSGSESAVATVLQEQISAAPKRVFVALFASNVHRLIALGEAAKATGRRICLLGRSLQRHVELARRLGYLKWSDSMLLPPEHLPTFPAREVLILTGGTQAEPASALCRLAAGQHRFVALEPGDRVIFSSRVIPGNERAVSSLIDQLLRSGVDVVSGMKGIHTSGHAYREEQRHLLELLRPRAFLPVHGTRAHLEEHARMAAQAIDAEVLVVENGQAAELVDGRLRRGPDFPVGVVALGLDRQPVSGDIVLERRQAARAGVVSVVVHWVGGELGCSVATRGVPFRADSDVATLTQSVRQYCSGRYHLAAADLESRVCRLVRSWCQQYNASKPTVLFHLVRRKETLD